MKKFTLTFVITLFAYLLSSGQCLPDGTILATQHDVDFFYYQGCSEVEGSILISGWFEPSDITDLDGLDMINTIGGTLAFGGMGLGNPILTSLAGLEGLTSIGYNLVINDETGALTDLIGLDGLTTIGNDLTITNNPVFASMNGLESLISIEGGLIIENNPSLNSLNGLEGLTTIGGDLIIKNNPSLTSLSGLENLTTVGGDLILDSNTVLASLNGLEGLTSIGGDLEIAYNPVLSDINELENIDYATINSLHIHFNPQLSECNIQSICDFLVAPNGTVDIHDNAPGCDNQLQVEYACGITGVGESSVNSRLFSVSIYPNPSSNTITLELPNTYASVENTYFILSNTNGQQLITRHLTGSETRIDISHFPVGIYIVKVWNDKDVMVQKVVKQ